MDEEWNIALNNTNQYTRDFVSGGLSAPREEQINDFHKRCRIDVSQRNPLIKNITFNEGITGIAFGKATEWQDANGVKYYRYLNQAININPNDIRADTRGQLFQISNGITHKRNVGGNVYAGIENILVPLEVVVAHEVGHSLYQDERQKPPSFKSDKTTDSRMISPLSGQVGSQINEEDAMNIMGNSSGSENEKRASLGLPLRYGYISPTSLKGGLVFYENEKKVLDMVEKISDMETDHHGLGVKGSALLEMENHLRRLPVLNASLNPNKVAYSFMKFRAVEDFLNHNDLQEEVSAHAVLTNLLSGTKISQSQSEKVSDNFKTTYKTTAKIYADGRPQRPAQDGSWEQFPRMWEMLNPDQSKRSIGGVGSQQHNSINNRFSVLFSDSYQNIFNHKGVHSCQDLDIVKQFLSRHRIRRDTM